MSRRLPLALALVATLAGSIVASAAQAQPISPATETGAPGDAVAPSAPPQAPPSQPGAAQPAQPYPQGPYGQPVYGQPYPQPYAQPYPQALPYYYPPPPPSRGRGRLVVGQRTETRSVRAMWVPGLVLLAAGWLGDIAITPLANSLSTDRDPAAEEDAWAWSLVPVAGPIAQLVIGAPHPAIPVMTGLFQIGGLVLFAVGVASQEQVRVPIYQGDPDDPTATRVDLGVAPTAGGGQIGLTVTHL